MRDDEHTLLAQWQAGDDRAGHALVTRHWPDVLRFFLASTGRDQASAEDLTQDTFATVVRRRDEITSTFRAYCYGVARMKRFEALRHQHSRPEPLEAEDVALPPTAPDQDRLQAKRLISVLRQLEPDEQLLLVLKDYLGFTQPELAETFKIPQPRVSGRINRARRRFQQHFERLDLPPQERALTLRSLDTVLRSIVARVPAALGLELRG